MTKVTFKGFEAPETKSNYEFIIDKTESNDDLMIEIWLTDHNIASGTGNTLKIARFFTKKNGTPYDNNTNVELLTPYAKTTSAFFETTEEDEPNYRTYTLSKVER